MGVGIRSYTSKKSSSSRNSATSLLFKSSSVPVSSTWCGLVMMNATTTELPSESVRLGPSYLELETPREDLHVHNEETDLHAEDVEIGVGSRPPAL